MYMYIYINRVTKVRGQLNNSHIAVREFGINADTLYHHISVASTFEEHA